MRFIQSCWHVLNFIAPALSLGAIAAFLVKCVWPQQLREVTWRQLAGWASAGASTALVMGLLLSGQDGQMITYTAMVLACALGLGWASWRRWP